MFDELIIFELCIENSEISYSYFLSSLNVIKLESESTKLLFPVVVGAKEKNKNRTFSQSFRETGSKNWSENDCSAHVPPIDHLRVRKSMKNNDAFHVTSQIRMCATATRINFRSFYPLQPWKCYVWRQVLFTLKGCRDERKTETHLKW